MSATPSPPPCGGVAMWGPRKDSQPVPGGAWLPGTSSRAEGGLGARRRVEPTILGCQERPKAEDLGHEDADGDEELGHHAQGPPQVLGGQLPYVHGDDVGRQTWEEGETETGSGN